jgi:predicted outer membrane repeat protein
VNFIDNLGAALRCLSDSNVAVFGTAKFVRNTAGSALGVTDTARLSLEYAEFSQNTSPGDGGAISMLAGGNLRITRGLLVDGNTCSQSGGGMHLTGGGRITFAPNSVATFSNNKATVDGGAVMMAQGGNIEFEADSMATFRGNKAEANGGAVSLSDGARLVLYKATMALNSADLGGALYMAVQGNTTVLPGGSICMSGNNAKTTGGGVYMKGATGGVLALDSAAATQVMGGNTPNALVVLEGGRFLCNGGPARGVGNATERIYEINGGSICSCPEPPAATGPLDALGTTTCASCPTGKQWSVDKCSCV